MQNHAHEVEDGAMNVAGEVEEGSKKLGRKIKEKKVREIRRHPYMSSSFWISMWEEDDGDGQKKKC